MNNCQEITPKQQKTLEDLGFACPNPLQKKGWVCELIIKGWVCEGALSVTRWYGKVYYGENAREECDRDNATLREAKIV